MNLPPRGASCQPVIKCSNCAADVELQSMSSHVCGSSTNTPFNTETQNHPAPQVPVSMTPAPVRRPHAPFVPKIDPFAFTREELTPSDRERSRAASPASAGPGRRSPFRPPQRKASMPSRRPPSPELISQDCAFPPFPLAPKPKRKDSTQSQRIPSRTQTPDSASLSSVNTFDSHAKRSASVGASRSRSRQDTVNSHPSTASNSRQASIDSRSNSREESKTIIPPIPSIPSIAMEAHRENNYSVENDGPPKPAIPPLSLPTQQSASVQNGDDSQMSALPFREQPPRFDPAPALAPAPAINSNTFDSIFSNAQSSNIPTREPSYKAKRPPPIISPQPFGMSNLEPVRQLKSPILPTPSSATGTLTRSLTGLFRKKSVASNSKRAALEPPTMKNPQLQAPSSNVQLSSTIDHTRSLSTSQRLNSPSHFENNTQQPQLFIKPPDQSIDIRSGDTKIGDAERHRHDAIRVERNSESFFSAIQHQQEFEKPTDAEATEEEASRRFSIDSASSYGSIGFSYSSTSSRTTNPTETPPYEGNGSAQKNLQPAFDFETQNKSPSQEVQLRPDSPTVPLNEHKDPLSEPDRVETSPKSVYSAETPAESLPAPPPEPQSSHPSRQRRPSTPGATKGFCRGCSRIIMSSQKSVSSKDGRLTGRYHKECFTCTTCKSAFATADFYVHNDHPYCAHHYHVENDTLCGNCGKGIEGQYMETLSVSGKGAKKFHPRCLTCDTCKIRLHNDYFELNGKVYCEKDAFRLASPLKSPRSTAPSRPSPLNREYVSSQDPAMTGPGRFPERRTTRLMMTY